nr:TPA_asm: m106.5 uORF 1 RNA *2 [Murid betaherpesvirus 1]DBA08065.1 TPA_asm: m106.5 uORF 1 RNA *2 [Murid betaherpesvirus 1]
MITLPPCVSVLRYYTLRRRT